MVPYPFSRGLFWWGEPLWVPSDADEARLEATRAELEASLNQLTVQADATVSSSCRPCGTSSIMLS